jgi:hypothetical protein
MVRAVIRQRLDDAAAAAGLGARRRPRLLYAAPSRAAVAIPPTAIRRRHGLAAGSASPCLARLPVSLDAVDVSRDARHAPGDLSAAAARISTAQDARRDAGRRARNAQHVGISKCNRGRRSDPRARRRSPAINRDFPDDENSTTHGTVQADVKISYSRQVAKAQRIGTNGIAASGLSTGASACICAIAAPSMRPALVLGSSASPSAQMS